MGILCCKQDVTRWFRMKRIFPFLFFFLPSKFSMPRSQLHPHLCLGLRSSLSARGFKERDRNLHKQFSRCSLSLLILNTDNESLHVNGFNSSLFNVAFYVEFHELLSLTRFTGNLFNSHPQALAGCHVTGSIEGSAVAFIEKAGRQVSERSGGQT